VLAALWARVRHVVDALGALWALVGHYLGSMVRLGHCLGTIVAPLGIWGVV